MCSRRDIPLAERLAEWKSRQAGSNAPAAAGTQAQSAPPAQDEADELDEDLEDIEGDEQAGQMDDAELDDDLEDHAAVRNE